MTDTHPRKEFPMKRSTLIATVTALVALAGAGSAFAVEATQDDVAQTVSGQSRASVRDELVAAPRAGTLTRGEASAPSVPLSTESRAVVAAETREAVRLGVAGANEAEIPMATPAQQESIRQAGLRALGTSVAQGR